ncbi:sugar kinase [Leucobacter tardus]|nr:sugar kinase [Leucobacter tardus]
MRGRDPETTRPIDVLCIGETMALVVPAAAEPVENATDFRLEVGGAESNVACHLAAAGHRAEWFSALGDDALGRRTLARVAEHGVATGRVRLHPHAPTGLYVKDPGAGVTYYRRGSAASLLSPEHLTGIDWGAVRILHLSGITPALSDSCRALVDAAIDAARAAGTTVSFDVNDRPALWPDRASAAEVIRDIANLADIVLVGRDEAEALWSAATAEEIRTLFPNTPHLIVKDADIEAVEFSAAGRCSVPALRVDVVESVGAGDAFAAGWLHGFLRDASPVDRIAHGHAFAARALSSTRDVPAHREHDTPTPMEGPAR